MSCTLRRWGHRAGVLALAAALAGCDRNAAELVRELEAARGGCTEEMLAAGAEECVRMFERYLELGAEAVETYIGGVRAFDEALRRHPGIRFDTAGLGRVLTPGVVEGMGGESLPNPSWRRFPRGRPYFQGQPPFGDPPPTPGGWEHTGYDGPERTPNFSPFPPSIDESGYGASAVDGDDSPRRDVPPEIGPLGGETNVFSGEGPPGRGGNGNADVAPQSRRRGVLLPPAERLRRPWIGDEPE